MRTRARRSMLPTTSKGIAGPSRRPGPRCAEQPWPTTPTTRYPDAPAADLRVLPVGRALRRRCGCGSRTSSPTVRGAATTWPRRPTRIRRRCTGCSAPWRTSASSRRPSPATSGSPTWARSCAATSPTRWRRQRSCSAAKACGGRGATSWPACRPGSRASNVASGWTRSPSSPRTPEASRNFNQAMSEGTRREAPGIIGSYDFTQFSTLVDVGGGDGTLLAVDPRRNARSAGHPVRHRSRARRRQPRRLGDAGVDDRCERRGGRLLRVGPRRWRRLHHEERHPRLGRRSLRDDPRRIVVGR